MPLVSGGIYATAAGPQPAIAVLPHQPLPTGATVTVPLSVSNVGGASGSWVVRGTLYDPSGHEIGAFVSQSTGAIGAGESITVPLALNGEIAASWGGQTLQGDFSAYSATDGTADTGMVPLSVGAAPNDPGVTIAITTPPAAAVGSMGTVGVTVTNTGSSAVYVLVDGVVRYGTVDAAYFASASATLAGGASQEFGLQTTGRFSTDYAGRSVEDVLNARTATGVATVTSQAYTVTGSASGSAAPLTVPLWVWGVGAGALAAGGVIAIAAASRHPRRQQAPKDLMQTSRWPSPRPYSQEPEFPPGYPTAGRGSVRGGRGVQSGRRLVVARGAGGLRVVHQPGADPAECWSNRSWVENSQGFRVSDFFYGTPNDCTGEQEAGAEMRRLEPLESRSSALAR